MSKRSVDPVKPIDGYQTLPADPGPGTYEVDIEVTHRIDDVVTPLHKETVTVETAYGRPQASASAQLQLCKTHPEFAREHVYTQVMEARHVAGPAQPVPAAAVEPGSAGEPVVDPERLEDGDEHPDYDYNFDKPFDIY
jgi:hypothetical protein